MSFYTQHLFGVTIMKPEMLAGIDSYALCVPFFQSLWYNENQAGFGFSFYIPGDYTYPLCMDDYGTAFQSYTTELHYLQAEYSLKHLNGEGE